MGGLIHFPVGRNGRYFGCPSVYPRSGSDHHRHGECPESSIARLCDVVLKPCRSEWRGIPPPFTAQLMVLACFVLCHHRGTLSEEDLKSLFQALMEVPEAMAVLSKDDSVSKMPFL